MQIGLFLATHRPRLVLPGSLVALFLALLALPSGVVSWLGPTGAYAPLVSLLLSGVSAPALPPGVQLLAFGPSEPLEIYLLSSVTFASMLGSPIVAYAVFRRMTPRDFDEPGRRGSRTVYLLTAAASAAFAAGALLADLFLVRLYVQSLLLPFSNIVGLAPILLDALDFYSYALSIMVITAVVFAAPVYVVPWVHFRRSRRRSYLTKS